MNKFIQSLLLIALAMAVSACSAKYDEPYHRENPPPVTTYPPPAQPSPGKSSPATQRPYTVQGQRYTPLSTAHGYEETGVASWYGRKFHGRKTSNGETYNMYARTCAHKTLPMNTWVNVENLSNGRQTTLRVNDRGPFVQGRIIDLSYTGANDIGMVGPGTAKVRVTALGKATSYANNDSTKPVAFTPVNYWKGNFTVQVGAFKVRTNAENFRAKLSRSYINAHIQTYEDDRGQFYRVRVGRFSKLDDAVEFAKELMTKEFAAAFAVAE